MKRHVTMVTKGDAVGNFVTKIRIISVGFYVVRREATLVLLALPAALLAEIAVALQNCFAPGEILGILEALPGATTFPVVVALASRKGSVLALCIENFRLRLIGHLSA